MAIVENDYAAYLKTSDGEIPLRDLDAQKKISSLSEEIDYKFYPFDYYINKLRKNVLVMDSTELSLDFSENGYYKPSSGGNGIELDTSTSKSKNTGFVEVGTYTKLKYKVNGNLPYIYYVAFFDKNRNFLEGVKTGVASNEEHIMEIPFKASYVVCSSFQYIETNTYAYLCNENAIDAYSDLNTIISKVTGLTNIGNILGIEIPVDKTGFYKPYSNTIVFEDTDPKGKNSGLFYVFPFTKIKVTGAEGATNYIFPIVFFDYKKNILVDESVKKTDASDYTVSIPEKAVYAAVSTWSSKPTIKAYIGGDYPKVIDEKILELSEEIKNLKNQIETIEPSTNSDSISFDCLDFGTFLKFGISGDSISVGHTQNPLTSETVNRNIRYSWGQFIARRNGNICLNFGKSGITSKRWMTDELCYQRLINPENLCQAYVIALGANDAAQENLSTVPFGSIDDVDFSNMENNGDTVYGWYAKVINAHRVAAPNAKIFLITIPYWRNTDQNVQTMNNLIRELASRSEFENVFLVDIDADYNDYFKNGVFPDIFYAGGHYSAIGYNYYSRIHEYAISKVMKDNYESFYDIPFIPFGDNDTLD